MSTVYNPLKLPEYRKYFKGKKVLVAGAGAVGSALMEFFAKMGVSSDALDFDRFTLENAAKGSCLVRTPEDTGRNKAECTSARIQPLLDEGCTSNGIDADLCLLGPEAFADYDLVALALDNYDAKILFNELVMQLENSRRPVVIMAGTREETAQSVILDGREFCLRCLIDESWLRDSSVRTSCGSPQIRMIDGVPEIIRTSNLASSMAAHLSAEQMRAFVTGIDGVLNRRLAYTAYPGLGISESRPMRKRGCPGCCILPPRELRWLHGSVLETTLEDMFSAVSQDNGTDDFEILVHQLHYRKLTHAEFILTDTCRVCGVMIPVSLLKDLAVFLMDLHGQSEHQFLTDPERHLAFLDQMGNDRHLALLEKVRVLRKDPSDSVNLVSLLGEHLCYRKSYSGRRSGDDRCL